MNKTINIDSPDTETISADRSAGILAGSPPTSAPPPRSADIPVASPPPISGFGKKYNLPGDKVYAATAALPDDQRNAVRWLHHFAQDNDLTFTELAAKLRRRDGSSYDANTLYKVLTGRHDAALDNICKSIIDLKKIADERGTIQKLGFIETALTKKIFDVCQAALIYQKINFITGESQIGKTFALEEYARRNNHGQTKLYRMPEGGGIRELCGIMAEDLGISYRSPLLRQRIIDAFDDRMLVIVDEFHQCFERNGVAQHRVVEFLRELFDRKKCGMVFSGTNVIADEFERGASRKWLRQTELRKLVWLKLPARPSKADLNTFARHYGLPVADGPAHKLELETIRDFGLGRWCAILQAASRLASKRGQKLNWPHVIDANAAILRLAQEN